MVDFKGNELAINDLVHYVHNNSLYEGKIDSITACQCKVKTKDGMGNYSYLLTIRHPYYQIFKIC